MNVGCQNANIMKENYEEQAVLGTSDKLREYTERKTLKKQEKDRKEQREEICM